jgi:hypothetical protein
MRVGATLGEATKPSEASAERFSCRGHLTRTEGRDGASPPREGRSDRKGKEQSEECERDLQASEATRRLKRRSRASDAPRFVVARSANTTRAEEREMARKGARGCVRPRAAGVKTRLKKFFLRGRFAGSTSK